MVVIAAHVRIRPEQRDSAVRAALAMAEASRREPGCRAYRFSADLADPLLFYVHEEWDDGDALQKHFATPHMATFRAELPAILAGSPSIVRFEIASSGPMG